MGLFGSSSSKKQTTVNNTTQAAQDEAINANRSSFATDGAINRSKVEIVNADPASVINSTNAYLNDTFETVLGFTEKQNQQYLESIGGDTESGGEKIKAFIPLAMVAAVSFGIYQWANK